MAKKPTYDAIKAARIADPFCDVRVIAGRVGVSVRTVQNYLLMIKRDTAKAQE